MPTYVYECAKCGDEFEVWQSFTDEPLKKHPGCGGKLTKVLQPVGIVFKGSGFYKTDSRSGSKRSTGAPSESEVVLRLGSSDKSESSSSDSSSNSKSPTPSPDSKKSDSLVVGHHEEEVRLVDVDVQVVEGSAPAHSPVLPPSLPPAAASPVVAGRTPHVPSLSPRARVLGRGGRRRGRHRRRGGLRSRLDPPSRRRPRPGRPRRRHPRPRGRPTSRAGDVTPVRAPSQLPPACSATEPRVRGPRGHGSGARGGLRPPQPRAAHRTGLDGVVPEGMRAIRVTVTDAARARAGAAVDVLASLTRAAATRRRVAPTWSWRGRRVLGVDRPRRGGTGAPARSASRCSSTPTGASASPTPRPTACSPSHWCHPRRRLVAPAYFGRLVRVDTPRHHPRDRAGPLGVPPDLVERPPHPRARAVRVERLTTNDSLEKSFDVALHLGTLIAALVVLPPRPLAYVVAALHSIAPARRHHGRRASRVAAAPLGDPGRDRRRLVHERSSTITSATRSSSAST